MANEGKDPPGGDEWKGDEVADAPPGEAEAAADRAGGRAPIDARSAAHDREQGAEVEGDATGRASERGGDDRRSQELKRQAAAEAHEEDRAAGTGTAPKNI